MKHIAVFTSSRSDWGGLEILVSALRKTKLIKISIVATGSHFDPRFGSTVNAISSEFSDILVRLDVGSISNAPEDAAAMAGRVTGLVGEWLGAQAPDAVVVLGDRFEALACGIAATVHNIPIIHLHGGEVTTGAIDDSVRHALSKLASLHFPVHEQYARRLIQMGENPESVVVAGSLMVEGIEQRDLLSRLELESLLGEDLPDSYIVCAVHPVTKSSGEVSAILDSLEQAFVDFPELKVFVTAPAPDPGFEEIEQRFELWCSSRPEGFSYHTSLGSEIFLSLVSHSLGLIGNSSSGLLEVPSVRVPTLNIGCRQRGRIRAASVIDAQANVWDVRGALARMLTPQVQEIAKSCANPIRKEHPSDIILGVIAGTDFSVLGPKLFFDLEVSR